MVVQTGDSLVAGGYTRFNRGNGGAGGASDDDFALARYNANGQWQGGFGNNGRQITDFSNGPTSDDRIAKIALQADGKVVAVGSAYETYATSNNYPQRLLAVARYDGSTGALDASLNPNTGGRLTYQFFGSTETTGNAIAIQPDGKWVVAGTTGRTTDGGTVDQFFGSSFGNFAVARFVTDQPVVAAPTLNAINRSVPITPVTAAASVTFLITFSKSVTGLTASNLALSGTIASSGTIGTPATGDGITWTVEVSGLGSATGTIGLNLANNTNIRDSANNPLATATQQGQTYTITRDVAGPNSAPVLDSSGSPFAILGVGSRQSTEMRQGTLVSDILARGANGNPITDTDAGALKGIAITAVDGTLGTLQYTLVTANPQESDWKNVVAAGAVSNTSALLLPTTARLRFTTGLLPHHASGAPFLPLESKLDAGFTFRAWDQTSGTVEGRADTTVNGGGSAFSTATETSNIYFEARLFRIFNTVAGLNIYTLEAEFNALTANPALVDRSTSGFTGFTILMSAVPELGTVPLFRLYFGVQFNDDGTQTDMGYRYLTSSEGEASILEGLGRADLRPTRQGAYFREIGDPRIPGDTGVNNGTAVLGYIYATQQPGTAQMTQVYRTDTVGKPTRPAGTVEGSTPTSTKPQEQGDHVYTTNIAFETGRPGTWRVEAARGFVRELTPSPTGVGPALAEETVVAVASVSMSAVAVPRALPAVEAGPAVVAPPTHGDVFKLLATGPVPMVSVGAVVVVDDQPVPVAVDGDDSFETPSAEWCDDAFADLDLVAVCGLGV